MSESESRRKFAVGLAWLITPVVCGTVLVAIWGQAAAGGPNYVRIVFELLTWMIAGIVMFGAMAASVPPNAQQVAWSDPIVARLVGAAIILFVSAKWIAPFLDRHLPFADWPKIFVVVAAALLAMGIPRKLNAPMARLASRYPGGVDKDTIAAGIGLWTFFLCLWLDTVRTGSTRSTISIGGITIGEIGSMASNAMMPIVLATLALAFWYFSKEPTESEEPVGIIVATLRAGLPALAWSQRVGTGDTEANDDARGRFKIYLGLIAVAAVLGLASGSFENAILWTVLAVWLGAFGLRGAGSLRTQGNNVQATPYVKTDSDRREEMTPMLRREDCEAFVEQSGPELWFCIARGDKRKGPLPIVERVPWESFGNFEEGSHKQWFRPRASVSDVADWGVIIAQSSVGRVLRVAESVNDHAWLVELLVRLQNTFVAPRDSITQAFREAAQKRSAPAGTTTGIGAPAMGETPVKPF